MTIAVPVQKPGSGTSINWHFDKDEDLLDEYGVYIHPFISTVTYLSDVGSPTVVIGARVTSEGELQMHDDGAAADDDDGADADGAGAADDGADDDDDDGDDDQQQPLLQQQPFDVYASYPVLGKHIAFNGRLLHGNQFLHARMQASSFRVFVATERRR
jgi:hypothetical protein